MFDLRLRYNDVGFRPVARQLAGLALLVVLVGLMAALAISMPEVTAETGDNKQYTRVIPVSEYPDVSPTANFSWGKGGMGVEGSRLRRPSHGGMSGLRTDRSGSKSTTI